MKRLLIFTLAILTLPAFGQDKYDYVQFNKLTEITGTEFVIASMENPGKAEDTKSKYLLFINTKTGATNQVDFPGDSYIGKPEQVKIDSLQINLIVVSARTIDIDGKSGIDWNDPTQINILSTDGKQRTQLTDDKFYVKTWAINKVTGTIVITGYYDTNNNNNFDDTDKNEITIYDLKTLKLIKQI